MSIKFRCECGQSYSAKESLAGKVVKCRNCTGTVRVPATATEESLDAYNLVPDESVAMSHAAESVQPLMTSCPECSSQMPAKAVLCVSCGYHQTLGKKIETSTKSKRSPKASGIRSVFDLRVLVVTARRRACCVALLVAVNMAFFTSATNTTGAIVNVVSVIVLLLLYTIWIEPESWRGGGGCGGG